MTVLRATKLIALALAATACSNSPGEGPVAGDDPNQNQRTLQPPGESSPDPTVQRLEREAMALARTSGCTTADQCRAAPVGSRPCGGPRYYLPYCSLTTDSAALFRKLEEVKRAEEDYNRRNQLASTCEFRMPPDLEVAGGACRAKRPGGP
jgi:hypothetical protein